MVVREAIAPVRAVVLVLPGGKANSFEATSPRQLTALRMRPFASSLHRHGAARGVEVRSLRYRIRGWNGQQSSPVRDALWAMEDIRAAQGDVRVALVGHSMGARTAIRVAGAAEVVSVVALAPWLPDDEAASQLRQRRLLIAHGTLDTVTNPRASLRFAKRASIAGSYVTYESVAGDMHAMLVRWRRRHRLATWFTLDALRDLD